MIPLAIMAGRVIQIALGPPGFILDIPMSKAVAAVGTALVGAIVTGFLVVSSLDGLSNGAFVDTILGAMGLPVGAAAVDVLSSIAAFFELVMGMLSFFVLKQVAELRFAKEALWGIVGTAMGLMLSLVLTRLALLTRSDFATYSILQGVAFAMTISGFAEFIESRKPSEARFVWKTLRGFLGWAADAIQLLTVVNMGLTAVSLFKYWQLIEQQFGGNHAELSNQRWILAGSLSSLGIMGLLWSELG